ncbi:MAG: hypothetical protein GVX78_05220 [Bacteroidetes bacterium]|nr:hypothetical protein [Bacteroidota bacterium]
MAFLLVLGNFCAAQDKENENPYKGLPLKERIFVGGGLGLSFGTITNIRIAPVVGYRVSPDLSFGLGPSYQYYSDSRFTPKLESTIYGLFLGAIFSLTKSLYNQNLKCSTWID